MIKSFLILIIFPIFLFSSQQIILVVADDFNTNKAILQFFEDDKVLVKAEVNLGTNGLGWGIGEIELLHKSNEALKYEGDKKSPAGIFKLTDIFGYSYESNYKLPYLHASKNLICVDDSDSNFYNAIIEANGNEKSFEFMKRSDYQYKYGIFVAHNKNAKRQRGSCIFLHIQKDVNSSTAGCTSMDEYSLKKIISLLDKNKNPILIQIPKSSLKEIQKLYPQLKFNRRPHHHQTYLPSL
ncbi:L,D-transpeptidase family protein [Sulfurimonas sp. SAG-AH-194-L11]|nr:L,D-transpeptidase family protein [Sulfurimonas sp. SAG-AH-194-L11]MDF1876821.1 L,D-transpeptidase family protein [Sulfurimonas sp. SAG-AH-194-L11]